MDDYPLRSIFIIQYFEEEIVYNGSDDSPCTNVVFAQLNACYYGALLLYYDLCPSVVMCMALFGEPFYQLKTVRFPSWTDPG